MPDQTAVETLTSKIPGVPDADI